MGIIRAMGKKYNIKVSFLDHLQTILELGKQRGWNKGRLCRAAGLPEKRWSDFNAGRKNFTAYYFLRFIGGLGLTYEKYEKKTGSRFTPEQKNELKYQKFTEVERETIELMMTNPEFLRDVKLFKTKYEGKK